jgi:hypothetical protein
MNQQAIIAMRQRYRQLGVYIKQSLATRDEVPPHDARLRERKIIYRYLRLVGEDVRRLDRG